MCGAYYLLKSPKLRERFNIRSLEDLKNQLSLAKNNPQQPHLPYISWPDAANQGMHLFRPTDSVPFLFNQKGVIKWAVAKHWWLVLDSKDGNWSPATKWASFNSKIEKLVKPGSKPTMHQIAPKSFRVLIPADGFIEWQPTQEGKQPIAMGQNGSLPMLLGGVAKAYKEQDQVVYSCSIITLPGHPRLDHIHKKSVPLIIRPEEVESWLSNEIADTEFDYLMETRLPTQLYVHPIDLKHKHIEEHRECIPED